MDDYFQSRSADLRKARGPSVFGWALDRLLSAPFPALGRIAQLDQTDCLPDLLSALGGSGRAAPKEEVRV
jgi:hypothetical protein